MIRPGRPADRARLRAIQAATLAEPAPELLAAGLEPGPPALLVAADGDIAGYALALDGGDTAYLAELAVAPDRQGEGVGTVLLEAVDDRVTAGRVRVTVRAGDPVRSFYESRGFERVERLPGFFGDRDGVALVR